MYECTCLSCSYLVKLTAQLIADLNITAAAAADSVLVSDDIVAVLVSILGTLVHCATCHT